MTLRLALLCALLLVAMILVAWAAFTLGDPARPLPRRPLPYPKHRTIPKHAAWGDTTRLVPLYVEDEASRLLRVTEWES